ncbi:hypothetical protein CLF_113305 [Clonorchis sinensis]|uniref:C2H2-type domain-containing protein n=1 Tax=Clonorchis sinensis TaxID=79923 RepID=G7YY49_CLOSI|nr:hypothetical protein CLF_113305 [Clonorchis sinensis]
MAEHAPDTEHKNRQCRSFEARTTVHATEIDDRGVPISTQERLVGLTCEECGKYCKSKASMVAHHRVHDNENCTGSTPPARTPTQHNADKLGRVKDSGVSWSQQESKSILHLANNLKPSYDTQTALFMRFGQYFPGRSAISITIRLRVLNLEAQSDKSLSGGLDQTIGQIAAYSSEADDYSVWFKQTVDCAVSLLESHADSSLASVDLLAFARRFQSSIMTSEQTCHFCDYTPLRHFHITEKLYPDAVVS